MGADARVWRHRTGEIVLDRTRVMGVLNVTPDSFSDGGRFATPDAAIAHALLLAEEGADLLDIGGESTRPRAEAVSAEEEWGRVGPVIGPLARKVDTPLSIDTRKPEVAKKALEAGVSIVNDVSGLRDPAMVRTVARHRAGAVIMHMRGEPKTMQDEPRYDDVVREVRTFLADRVASAAAGAIPVESLAVDPGIGFGKTLEHNLALLRRLREIADLGRPVVIGVSRKSFLGGLGGGGTDDRLPGSLAAAALAVAGGACVVRAHDVLETVRAMRVADAILGARENL